MDKVYIAFVYLSYTEKRVKCKRYVYFINFSGVFVFGTKYTIAMLTVLVDKHIRWR